MSNPPEEGPRDEANDARPVRDTTRNLYESLLFDTWPRAGAIVDFGLDSQEHYEALYYPVREGEITPEALDAALGNGPLLTGLARDAPSNPHKGIEFHTSYDELRAASAPEELVACDISAPSEGPAPDGGGIFQVWHDSGSPEDTISRLLGGSALPPPDGFAYAAIAKPEAPVNAVEMTDDSSSPLRGDGSRTALDEDPGVRTMVKAPRGTTTDDVTVDPGEIAHTGIETAGPPAPSPSEIAGDDGRHTHPPIVRGEGRGR